MARRPSPLTEMKRLLRAVEAPARAPRTFWEAQIERLVEDIEDMGYDVTQETKAQDRVELADRTIFINRTKHAESRFYTLLHEIGHILIRKGWKRFRSYYPSYPEKPYDGIDRRSERSRSYHVALIAEEIEAWRRGLDFARRRKYFVDPLKYDRESSEAVHSYFSWVSGITSRSKQAGAKAAKTRARRARKRR